MKTMNMHYLFIFFALFLVVSCSEEKTKTSGMSSRSAEQVEQQIMNLCEIRTEAEKNDAMEGFLAFYDENAISMPEYQPTLTGIHEIKAYYEEIFKRQDIKLFRREANEFIHLDSTIVEKGTFKKEYLDSEADTLITQNGKYWHVWDLKADGSFKLKGEAYGYFHHVEAPESLTVAITSSQPDGSTYLNQEIPFELKAYNALMEKGVRNRDGILRSEFFTNDGQFMPFADSTITGMDKIKPYLLEYSSRGEVTIDSILCSTYHYERFENHVLEYAKFKVKWTVPGFSGRTEGKGIRIWQRQEDNSLKLYREIGTHNHL